MKQRNYYLDYLRGWAILIVVLGHALQICAGNPFNRLHSIIQTFQMPLLFVISGFSVGYSEPITDVKKFFLGKIKRIAIPYLIWGQINYLLTAALSGTYNVVSQVKMVWLSQFWFLRILFYLYVVYLIYYGIVCVFQKTKWLGILLGIVATAISVVGISLIPGATSIVNYSLFFAFGYILYQGNVSVKIPHISNYFFILCGVLTPVFIASAVLFFKTEGMLQFLIDKSMAFTGSAALCFACKMLYNRNRCVKPRDFMVSVGRSTLPIYAIHWCILLSIPLPIYTILTNAIGIYPTSLIVTVVWTAICIACIFALRKWKITRLLLLGEK